MSHEVISRYFRSKCSDSCKKFVGGSMREFYAASAFDPEHWKLGVVRRSDTAEIDHYGGQLFDLLLVLDMIRVFSVYSMRVLLFVGVKSAATGASDPRVVAASSLLVAHVEYLRAIWLLEIQDLDSPSRGLARTLVESAEVLKLVLRSEDAARDFLARGHDDQGDFWHKWVSRGKLKRAKRMVMLELNPDVEAALAEHQRYLDEEFRAFSEAVHITHMVGALRVLQTLPAEESSELGSMLVSSPAVRTLRYILLNLPGAMSFSLHPARRMLQDFMNEELEEVVEMLGPRPLDAISVIEDSILPTAALALLGVVN